MIKIRRFDAVRTHDAAGNEIERTVMVADINPNSDDSTARAKPLPDGGAVVILRCTPKAARDLVDEWNARAGDRLRLTADTARGPAEPVAEALAKVLQ
jgi:hypothetical protein|tara:strand:+ start:156 stop:449 length:294 start_codon:yes stop_codon:yes gene_type:complete